MVHGIPAERRFGLAHRVPTAGLSHLQTTPIPQLRIQTIAPNLRPVVTAYFQKFQENLKGRNEFQRDTQRTCSLMDDLNSHSQFGPKTTMNPVPALALVAILSATSLAAPPKWSKVRSTKGRYSAEFPSKPTVTQKGHIAFFGAGTYGITVIEKGNKNPPKDFLKLLRDVVVTNVRKKMPNAKLLRDKQIIFNARAGREFVIGVNKKPIGYWRILSTQKHIYINSVTAPPKNNQAKLAQRFLDSFSSP